MSGALSQVGLSEAERLIFMERLYGLLRLRTEKYLAGDSSSLPTDTAEELLRSLVFTLRLALRETGRQDRELLTRDLEELLDEGQILLRSKLSETRRLWERACLTAPRIPNAYLKDTLRGFRSFFKSYDLRYFAHRFPCSVDYPLCIPVSEELQGVSYAGEWLRRLLIENRLLGAFSREAVVRVLTALAPDFSDSPLNLCEQPLINAAGLAMLGKSARSPELSDGDLLRLDSLLFGGGDIRSGLEHAAALVFSELGAARETENYLRCVILDAAPRLEASGRAKGVFISTNG